MTARDPVLRRLFSTAIMAVLFVLPAHAAAQAGLPRRTDTLSTRIRDSLLAAVLADTLDLDLDTPGVLPPLSVLRQSFTVRPTVRRYSVGTVNASEQTSYASWAARFRYATLRLDLTPLSYSSDTSTTARRPPVGFNGISPISGRLDIPIRLSDTLRVFAQSMSFPGALSSTNAQALGAVGTSTIDLDAGSIGMAARIGMKYVLTQPIGDDGVSLSLRGGVEYDPKPSESSVVSWRGTTILGGVGISKSTANVMLGASAQVTRSFADSLGGRNLFPGGGTLNVDARALRFYGADGDRYVSLNGFYSRPFDIERNDQPTRLIPIGDFAGVVAAASIPVGRLSVLPSLSHLRESSTATAVVNGRETTLDASGYTSTVSVGVSMPIGRMITLTPEVGGAFGTVGQVVSAQFPRRVRRRGFSDPIRGGWMALEFSISR